MKQFWEDLQKLGYKIHNKRVLSELDHPLKISKETLETDKCMEFALILKWFRDKHKIVGRVTVFDIYKDNWIYQYNVFTAKEPEGYIYFKEFNSFEEAELDLIKELIKIVK